MTKRFQYKGTPVYVRLQHTGRVSPECRRTCPICGEQVDDCESVLIANNCRIFPNVLLHGECYRDYMGDGRMLCAQIEEQYGTYRKLDGTFGAPPF